MTPQLLCETLNKIQKEDPARAHRLFHSTVYRRDVGELIFDHEPYHDSRLDTPLAIANFILAKASPEPIEWQPVVPVYRGSDLVGFRVSDPSEFTTHRAL